MAMFYKKQTSLTHFALEEGPISPTGQFKQSLDSFYILYSPLNVTNKEEMAMFYIKMTILNDFSLDRGSAS